MSRENVDLARWAFTSDPTRFFSLFDEDIELDARAVGELPGADLTGRGRECVERYCREYWGTWADYHADPQDFFETGDHVVVEVHERGKGKGSGVPFERTHTQVWTFRNGKVIRWALFAERAQALEAVKLAE